MRCGYDVFICYGDDDGCWWDDWMRWGWIEIRCFYSIRHGV